MTVYALYTAWEPKAKRGAEFVTFLPSPPTTDAASCGVGVCWRVSRPGESSGRVPEPFESRGRYVSLDAQSPRKGMVLSAGLPPFSLCSTWFRSPSLSWAPAPQGRPPHRGFTAASRRVCGSGSRMTAVIRTRAGTCTASKARTAATAGPVACPAPSRTTLRGVCMCGTACSRGAPMTAARRCFGVPCCCSGTNMRREGAFA